MKIRRSFSTALVALATAGMLTIGCAGPNLGTARDTGLALASSAKLALNSVAKPAAAKSVAVAQPVAAKLAAAQPATAGPGTAALTGDLQSTLEQVYQNTKDSVVNIEDTMTQGGQTGQALGSGFVWDTNGHIVTNNHVIDGATNIIVTFADGNSAKASLVGRDPDSDLAVLQVPTKGLNLKPITVADSSAVVPGQFTVAIGNPFGLDGTLTFGIVSAVGRSMPANEQNALASGQGTYTIPDIIQTDAPINPGNSGGALLDLNGKLIGVPTAIQSQTGQNGGIGFAVPSKIVSSIVPLLIKNGKVEHAWLGMSGTTLNAELAQAMNLPATQRGALVESVTSGGPADKAGVQGSTQQTTINGTNVNVGGDVITAIDNQPVTRFEDLVSYLAGQKAGNQVTLTVLRDGQEKTLMVTLGSRPASTSANSLGNNQQLPNQLPNNRNGRGNNQGNGQNNQGNGQNGNQGNNQQQLPNQRRLPNNRNGQNNGQNNPGQGQQQAPASQGWLGIGGVTVTNEIAQAMNLDNGTQGVLVESISPNSPAEQANLVAGTEQFTTSDGQDIMIGGDVITAVDGKPVTTIQQLAQMIGQSKPGQKVTLTVTLDGNEEQLSVTLAARPAQLTQ
jgi:serine protease Do